MGRIEPGCIFADKWPAEGENQAKGGCDQAPDHNDGHLIGTQVGGGKIGERSDTEGEYADQANRHYCEFNRLLHTPLDKEKGLVVVSHPSN